MLVDQWIKPVHTNIFANNCKLHTFATTNSNFVKSDYFSMNHRITYIYINFQQIRVSRSCSQNRAHKYIGKQSQVA